MPKAGREIIVNVRFSITLNVIQWNMNWSNRTARLSRYDFVLSVTLVILRTQVPVSLFGQHFSVLLSMLVFVTFSENLCAGGCTEGSVEKEKFHVLSDPSVPQLKFKTNQHVLIKDK